jgi:hypothetical protein
MAMKTVNVNEDGIHDYKPSKKPKKGNIIKRVKARKDKGGERGGSK